MSMASTRCGSALHRVVSRRAYSPCVSRPYSSYVFQGPSPQSPLGFQFAHASHPITFTSPTNIPPENDIALIQKKTDPSAKQSLSTPLRPGKRVKTSIGEIQHESIIGLSPRAVISTEGGKGTCRVYRPTLGEYTNLTPRIVTPVSIPPLTISPTP